ncbi:hypothetical protein QZH41_000666 [Actinostola sp. cb2023]|nr:hypothetical protein QZH41_000666 [Actinostola sp. cb2023]
MADLVPSFLVVLDHENSFGLKIKVWDDDSNHWFKIGSQDDLVDKILFSVANIDAKKESDSATTFTISGRRSSTRILVKFYCVTHYYGKDCGTHCVAHDDNSNGHYTCDANGNKICRQGWKHFNCLTVMSVMMMMVVVVVMMLMI